MQMKFPKCPNCGSTAQVRENIPHTTSTGKYISQKYVCGCGCYFDDPALETLCQLMEENKDVLIRLKNS